MALDGELVVRLDWDGGRVRAAHPRSVRPRASRVLIGRRAEEAPALAGRLFAICGRSQSVAAESAQLAARGAQRDEASALDAGTRVCAETIHEHLWRLLIDWPRLIDIPPRSEALIAVRRALAPVFEGDAAARESVAARLGDIAQAEIYGTKAADWLAIADLDSLAAWCRAAPTPTARLVAGLLCAAAGEGAEAVGLLPEPDDAALREGIVAALDAEPDYERAPHWKGKPRETGPLARMARHPLVRALLAARGAGVLARLVARLAELARSIEVLAGDAPARARHGGFAIAQGDGLGWVECARGLLVHRTRLAGERIADYRIVAPTEWNFHPRGAFARGALAIEADSEAELERRARRLAASLDPCVALRLEIGHA
jgi:hypothetical protein